MGKRACAKDLYNEKKKSEETYIITKPEGEVATFETCGQQK